MMISNEIADRILARTEISGNRDIEYTATIPSSSSGISFGRLQLDIATNGFAQARFASIMAAGGSTVDSIARLSQYVGVRSRDYSPELQISRQGALSEITHALSKSAAQSQVEIAVQEQLDFVVRGVNQILTRYSDLYPGDTSSVLNPSSPNYDYAIAYLVAAKNVNGYIPEILDLLAINPIISIEDLTSRYSNVNFSQIEEISRIGLNYLSTDQCFLGGTLVSMWNGSKKPIEEIETGDVVVSYDKHGILKPGRVKRTFTNRAKQILDVHGLMVTPGHAILCGDGRFNGQHVPILDILRSDGALIMEDGTKIRASTGCGLGTLGDQMISAVIGELHTDGFLRVTEVGQIRAGTRFILGNGEHISVLSMILDAGGLLTEDGMIQTSSDGAKMPFRWTFTSALPKPEDYVLQRSATHLQDIYLANEWEAIRPSMAHPMGSDAVALGWKYHSIDGVASTNMPLGLRNRSDVSQTNRKHRRAAEARSRSKAGTVH